MATRTSLIGEITFGKSGNFQCEANFRPEQRQQYYSGRKSRHGLAVWSGGNIWAGFRMMRYHICNFSDEIPVGSPGTAWLSVWWNIWAGFRMMRYHICNFSDEISAGSPGTAWLSGLVGIYGPALG
ncbi:hypothetical protein JTB14_024774 [Gonioctena quinquepunctata]|nr:hypothetical protein JTB14_024774 [Gonioctena quinquepunctata]